MKGTEIRRMFLKYFQDNGHTMVKSSSLVPGADPSLLFTNAGMVQFKSTFLGTEKRPYTRATSSQKCVRAGGKHNDLENVGRTARHHTFFEMLGNFSFGDYFKEQAIEYAWRLLVDQMGLPPDKLWITVHESDDQALDIWHKKIGIDLDRLVRLGDKDNFWSMGDTGPCGPCSEIMYDQGPSVGCGRKECFPGICDCDRYLEIWNLVFMQYNRDKTGAMNALPNPSIDTGMGLERIAAVLQGVNSNYDSDLFSPLIHHIAELTGHTYNTDHETDTSIRVIADHARACAFLVSDGVLPSNEGRGYVLRRIIRRAARHSKLLGVNKTFLHDISMKVVQEMGDVYPELLQRRDFIDKVISNEEERFISTLETGLGLLDEIIHDIKAQKSTLIPGDAVFKLYDTFGFPVDLTRDIAEKQGIEIDNTGFETCMEKQRQKARASGGFENTKDTAREDKGLGLKVEFAGYDTLETQAWISRITNDTEQLHEGKFGNVFTDQTPFYGESGGQAGDTGIIYGDGFKAEVINTTKTPSGAIMHHVLVKKGKLAQGQRITLQVDEARRKEIMRHHSATHLLQKALQSVLGNHVHQSGSLVNNKRLRFDFTHFSPMTDQEIEKVETWVNTRVMDNLPINTCLMPRQEAMKTGAMALFNEKYADVVRVVTMGDGVSVELCGGTHCRNTGEIGLVRIVSEAGVAAGTRRIEAVCGMQALEHMRKVSGIVSKAADQFRCTPAEIRDRISASRTRIKDQEETIKKLRLDLAMTCKHTETGPDTNMISVNNINTVIRQMKGVDQAGMREMGDRIKTEIKSGVILLIADGDKKKTFMIMATKDMEKKIHAGNIMKAMMSSLDGQGGGKAIFAQGGTGTDIDVNRAIELFKKLLGDNI
ncbi:MAG: alanine--tRNA ligase [Thermodesulfobacteriota bacterium]|nr:alanine--tRNA ligase [Thermodesulfobacteriota bacterium]